MLRLGAPSGPIISCVCGYQDISSKALTWNRNPLIAVAHTGQQALEVLDIAHRYKMVLFEQTIIARLEVATTTAEFVDLMVASKILDSEPLRTKAMNGLLVAKQKPSLEEAKRLGVEVYYALWNQTGSSSGGSQCYHCNSIGCLYCRNCNFNHSQ